MIIIKIDTDNSAFEDDKEGEVARILKRVAELVKSSLDFKLFDINGNCVGYLEEIDD